MALKQLNEQQIREWTLEQKDRWWLENVFRGNMPQLTIRSAITGFLLGGLLSATNLYVGAKTGWSLGVGITSVILAFGMFKALQTLRISSEFTILENNAMQSIAVAAGYMTSPLISSLTAYMMVKGTILPWHQIMIWNVLVSIMGVLFAFPLKRRFINDEQHAFPEGKACGVVMDTLHSSDAKVGVLKAKILMITAGIAAFVKFLQAEGIQEWIQFHLINRNAELMGRLRDVDSAKSAIAKIGDGTRDQLVALQGNLSAAVKSLGEVREQLHAKMIYFPEQLDVLAERLGFSFGGLKKYFWGIDPRQMTITPALDLALMGAGGLMGIKAASSLFIGAVLNYCILCPWMATQGEILPRTGSIEAGDATYGMRVVTLWALWPGVACMVVASFVAFFAKPQLIIGAFKGMFSKKKDESQVLKNIEFPLWISIVGVPILAIVTAFVAHAYFDVSIWLTLAGLPLMFVLALIGANSTALTGTTPVGATAKITQLFYGGIAKGQIHTNIAMGSATAEVVSNSSNLLMDIKPGYMLGAKPRQQAIGHVIGIFAGALASTPLYFILFTSGIDKSSPESIKATIDTVQSTQFPMPAVTVWKAVAEVLTKGFRELAPSVQWACMVAALVGLVFEVSRIATKGKFPLSPVAMGLAFVINFQSSLAMFAGAFLFWCFGVGRKRPEGHVPSLIEDNHEPICAGIIAGAALMGILDALLTAFVLT
jgi:uncharacterized oligopeptide transporter (OPT) family protein